MVQGTPSLTLTKLAIEGDQTRKLARPLVLVVTPKCLDFWVLKPEHSREGTDLAHG